MGDKTSAIVTTSVGHPFIFSSNETTGNIGLDIDVALPFIINDTYSRAGFVLGLGAMAHPQTGHSSTSNSGGGITPPGLFSRSAISPEVAAVDSMHDRGEKSDSSALSVVQARFGLFLETTLENFIDETDASIGTAITIGYANSEDNPYYCDIMWDASFFLYFTPQVAAGISVDTGLMSDFTAGSETEFYVEPSLALRFEL